MNFSTTNSIRIEAVSYFYHHHCSLNQFNCWAGHVKDKCCTRLHIMQLLCFPAHPHLRLHLKFIQLSWKGIIYEQICSLEWLVLFLLYCTPLMQFCWDRLSESPFFNGAIVPKHQIQKKLAVFENRNIITATDIIIIPTQNIHCPISLKLLLRFCVSVVLFVLNWVFMSSHGRMEVTTG